MVIATAQIDCVLGDLNANVRKVAEFVRRSRDARVGLVLFPEMVDTGYSMPVIRECARPWDAGAVPDLQLIARKEGVAIICGVSEREGESIFNTQVAIDAAGTVTGKYRKTHLFTPAPIEEHTCFGCGNSFEAVAHEEFKIGVSICYDLRFPEVYRTLVAHHKANVFAISSAWPFPRVEHWRVLGVARAIENQCYVIAANRVGSDDGITFCGSSQIVDPYGVVLASGSTDREELLVAELSIDVLNFVRERMPVIAHRRTDLY